MRLKFQTPLFYLILTICFSFSSQSLAQKITIKKIKGLSAIIESSIPLEEGQSYDLQTSPISSDVNYSAQGFKSRKNSVTLGVNFSTFNSDSVQNTYFSFQGRYGWNFSFLEFGLVGQGNYSDDGSGAKTDFAIGGYFDYNLITNRDLKSVIYGPFTLITIGSTQKKGGAASIIDANVGGFISYFPNKGATAFRIEAMLDDQQIISTSSSTNIVGFGGRALILYYF